MEMKRAFFRPVLQPVKQLVTTHLLTINFGLLTYNFDFGKTYKFAKKCFSL